MEIDGGLSIGMRRKLVQVLLRKKQNSRREENKEFATPGLSELPQYNSARKVTLAALFEGQGLCEMQQNY